LLVRSGYSHSIPNDIRNGLVILLTSVFFLISGITSPSYNWDIVAYVAAAYQQGGLSGSELSSATYNEIEREVDAETFKELTVGEYVDVVFKDPKSLEQQMPFYSIKVIYIQLMRFLRDLSRTLVQGGHEVTVFLVRRGCRGARIASGRHGSRHQADQPRCGRRTVQRARPGLALVRRSAREARERRGLSFASHRA